jgi:hypothetical protein
MSEQLVFDLDAAERELEAIRKRVSEGDMSTLEVEAAVKDAPAPNRGRPVPAQCRCTRGLLFPAEAFDEVRCSWCGKAA